MNYYNSGIRVKCKEQFRSNSPSIIQSSQPRKKIFSKHKSTIKQNIQIFHNDSDDDQFKSVNSKNNIKPNITTDKEIRLQYEQLIKTLKDKTIALEKKGQIIKKMKQKMKEMKIQNRQFQLKIKQLTLQLNIKLQELSNKNLELRTLQQQSHNNYKMSRSNHNKSLETQKDTMFKPPSFQNLQLYQPKAKQYKHLISKNQEYHKQMLETHTTIFNKLNFNYAQNNIPNSNKELRRSNKVQQMQFKQFPYKLQRKNSIVSPFMIFDKFLENVQQQKPVQYGYGTLSIDDSNQFQFQPPNADSPNFYIDL